MKTGFIQNRYLAAYHICLLLFAAVIDTAHADSETDSLVGKAELQVHIKAKVIESKPAETLRIKFSCPTPKTTLDFVDGVSYIPHLFIVTNTQQSVSANTFHKMNGKKTKAIFKTGCHHDKHVIALKVKKGILSGKIISRSKIQKTVPSLLGIPLLPTEGERTKSLTCTLNILNEIEGQGQADIRFSVNKNLIMLVKPIIIKNEED